MIKYIPFLKFKQNEILGIGELEQGIRNQIAPLFDIPRTQRIMDAKEIDRRLDLAETDLNKTTKQAPAYPFLIDNFDIDDSIDLYGVPQYRAILNRFCAHPIVPVIAFDRHVDHNDAALDHITKKPGAIAIRLQPEDLASYNLTKINLNAIWPKLLNAKPSQIILLLDFRVMGDVEEAHKRSSDFLAKFLKEFSVSVLVVAGSIIPANITQLIGTAAFKHAIRLEHSLWQALRKTPGLEGMLYGDYGVVSPEYSDLDLDPKLMNNVSTPKVFYPYSDSFYIERGRRFRTHGYGQYFSISDAIVKQPFFRGEPYSYGDKYIHDRSFLSALKPAKGGSPSTWIKSLTAAHVTFIVNSV